LTVAAGQSAIDGGWQSLERQPEKENEEVPPGSAWLDDPLQWSFAAAKLAMDTCLWWVDRGPAAAARPRESTLAWTTPNTVALELPTMRLRDFSRRPAGQPVLICAPFALHRALIADFAPGHSIVASLRHAGIERIFLTDWHSASPEMRYLSIDNYLSDLNVAIDEIGSPVDLVGLCQGGWLSLVYAARFPDKIRRLVLVGAPVDLSIDSALSQLVRNAPRAVFEQLVARGGGNVSGEEMLRFWTKSLSPREVEAALQRSLSTETPDARELLDRFNQWNEETLDLPGTYYLQIVEWIFRENRIATQRFVALGRTIHLDEVKTPVFLLVGQDDEVVPAQQGLATVRLLGTPTAFTETASEACNHLGLFLGAGTHASSWPRIAGWLQSDLTGFRARSAHPA
jgi:poly(3-hydroxyalkanoate) synthetase